jgi:hypothetical protein
MADRQVHTSQTTSTHLYLLLVRAQPRSRYIQGRPHLQLSAYFRVLS